MPTLPTKRGRGHPKVYSDRQFLKALVIMIMHHLHTVHELLSVLAQPTAEMTALRQLLREQESFPSRRTWERRQSAIPDTLPAQIGCLGRHLIDLINPWATCGRAVAIARGCTKSLLKPNAIGELLRPVRRFWQQAVCVSVQADL